MAKPDIPLSRAKSHLRIEHDLDDDEIALFASAAVDRTLQELGLEGCLRARVDEVSAGEYGRRAWEGNPCGCRWHYGFGFLPTGPRRFSFDFPVISVTQVEAWDSAAQGWTILDPSTWNFTGPDTERPFLTISSSSATRFRVTWDAGWEKAPAWFTLACLFLIAHYYENRSSIIVGQGVEAIEMPQGWKHLLAPHKSLLFA